MSPDLLLLVTDLEFPHLDPGLRRRRERARHPEAVLQRPVSTVPAHPDRWPHLHEGQSNFGTHDLNVSTYGTISTSATHFPLLVPGLIQTTSGNITLTANQQANPTPGFFQGVQLYGSIRSVSGDIVIAGRAGDGGGSGVIPLGNGVFVGANQSIESTGSGSVTVTGTGGASTAAGNNGV